QARRYMLTAERFGASVAHDTGLVHTVADDLESALQPLLTALIDNSPAAVTAAKRLALDIDQQPMNEATRRTTIERIAAIRVSAEGQEGLQAFLEKRTPAWKKG
ncbi:gamma-carboxygeranoyl-CoA hydratase, partial [Marinobacter sp. Z-F4-2]